MPGRLQAVFRELDADQRMAGAAAFALLVTLFLPWYDATLFERGRPPENVTYSAFGVFSFIEAAILLVALGVFVLLFARGERRGFHLPGGDGTVIFAAGIWSAVLLLWRVFDRPDVERSVQVGISWGFFFAFVAAAALAAVGWRLRVAARPEPPLPEAAGRTQPRTATTEAVPRRRRPPSPPAAAPGPEAGAGSGGGAVSASEEATRRLPVDDEEADPDPLRPGEIPRAPDRP